MHKKILIIVNCFITLGLSQVMSELRPIDQCSKWNTSEKHIIYEHINITMNNTDYLLNLSNSNLDINRETGEIAVLDDNNRRILVYNRSNFSTLFMILSNSSNLTNTSMIQSPSMSMAYDGNSSIYIVDSWEEQIIKLNNPLEYGENATVVANGSNLTNIRPAGLCVDNIDGSVFISDYDNHRILQFKKYQLSGTSYVGSGIAGNASDQFRNPTSIVIDDKQTLYVNDFGNERIQVFPNNSTTGTTLPTNISGCCIGLSLYLSEVLIINTKTSVYLFNLTTNETTCAIGCNDTTLNNIHNALIGNDGNIILTDSNLVYLYPIYEECLNVTTIAWISTTVSTIFNPINNCPSGTFGVDCLSSENICSMTRPCLNSGICTENNTIERGYTCECPWGFHGNNCENDLRPCKPTSCFQQGNCTNTSETEYHCDCFHGYEGINCQMKVNLCANVTCQNRGVCSPQFLNYTCHCLAGFHGRLCENIETTFVLRGYVTKSFGYIAILMLALVIGFIVIMDVLKYGFGIDPVQSERDALRRRRNLQKDIKPTGPKVAYRYRYVN